MLSFWYMFEVWAGGSSCGPHTQTGITHPRVVPQTQIVAHTPWHGPTYEIIALNN